MHARDGYMGPDQLARHEVWVGSVIITKLKGILRVYMHVLGGNV